MLSWIFLHTFLHTACFDFNSAMVGEWASFAYKIAFNIHVDNHLPPSVYASILIFAVVVVSFPLFACLLVGFELGKFIFIVYEISVLANTFLGFFFFFFPPHIWQYYWTSAIQQNTGFLTSHSNDCNHWFYILEQCQIAMKTAIS